MKAKFQNASVCVSHLCSSGRSKPRSPSWKVWHWDLQRQNQAVRPFGEIRLILRSSSLHLASTSGLSGPNGVKCSDQQDNLMIMKEHPNRMGSPAETYAIYIQMPWYDSQDFFRCVFPGPATHATQRLFLSTRSSWIRDQTRC